MLYNGIKLCGEVQQFQTVVGNLLTFYRPPNDSALEFSARDVRACINALFDTYKAQIQRNYLDGGPGTLERKRLNWSVAQLKRDKTKFTKAAYQRMKRNIWHG